jgi:plasmid stabilization system protein ParE
LSPTSPTVTRRRRNGSATPSDTPPIACPITPTYTVSAAFREREEIVHPNYILIYRVSEVIEVAAVLHARQQYL